MGKEEQRLGPDRSFGSRLESDLLRRRQTPKAQRPPNSDIKFTLFSGHDTVIAPVLAALGVYDKFCTWPPYASRIAFELWRNNRIASRTRPANETIRDYYVRVLFNGKDVTQYIPTCQRAASEALAADQDARYKSQKRNPKVHFKDMRQLDEVGQLANLPSGSGEIRSKYLDPSFEKMHDSKHLCSLTAFAEQIDGLLDGAKSMSEACHL